MQKINAINPVSAPTRWICTQCHRQYTGAKPCSFCHSALFSVPVGSLGKPDKRWQC
ncbi:putative zinc ribbon protein [Serratia fonticola]|uniref:putative zinc ribbon protein n=1 Tax=Serratia fonticola TaxID=47917 RepID=UPI00358F6CAA